MAGGKRYWRCLHSRKPQILVENVEGIQSHLDYWMPVRTQESFGEICSKGQQRNGLAGGGDVEPGNYCFKAEEIIAYLHDDWNDLVERESWWCREERFAGVYPGDGILFAGEGRGWPYKGAQCTCLKHAEAMNALAGGDLFLLLYLVLNATLIWYSN